jgi:hypothetical protein
MINNPRSAVNTDDRTSKRFSEATPLSTAEMQAGGERMLDIHVKTDISGPNFCRLELRTVERHFSSMCSNSCSSSVQAE